MVDVKQLEIPFETQIQAALAAPETTSIKSLWAALEPALSALPDETQLQVAARAIAQLADVIESKAELLFEAWEQRYVSHSLCEPVLSADLLAGVLRQSMHLDLTDAVQVYSTSPRQIEPLRNPIQSVVQEMDKADLLELLDEDAQAYAEAIAVAHDEDVLRWIEAIAQYLQHLSPTVKRVRVLDMQNALDQPLIEIWLGLLLGEVGRLEQGGDFYATDSLYVSLS